MRYTNAIAQHVPLKYPVILSALLLVSFASIHSQSNSSPPQGTFQLLGVTLGQTTLSDVQAAFGESSIHRCSRGEEAAKEICYTSATADKSRVIFQSGFSGGWKDVDGFRVSDSSVPENCFRKCPVSTKISGNIHTASRLRLGMTRDQVTQLLGAPLRMRTDRLRYRWQSRQPMTKEQIEAVERIFKAPVTRPYYDVTDSLELKLMQNKVIAFSATHVASY